MAARRVVFLCHFMITTLTFTFSAARTSVPPLAFLSPRCVIVLAPIFAHRVETLGAPGTPVFPLALVFPCHVDSGGAPVVAFRVNELRGGSCGDDRGGGGNGGDSSGGNCDRDCLRNCVFGLGINKALVAAAAPVLPLALQLPRLLNRSAPCPANASRWGGVGRFRSLRACLLRSVWLHGCLVAVRLVWCGGNGSINVGNLRNFRGGIDRLGDSFSGGHWWRGNNFRSSSEAFVAAPTNVLPFAYHFP